MFFFSDEFIVVSLVVDLINILECGGFYFIKFMLNSKNVLVLIFVERRVVFELNFELDELLVERVLGVC